MKANELKRGSVFQVDGQPIMVKQVLVVQVPEYLIPGEKIKINVETREFIARA